MPVRGLRLLLAASAVIATVGVAPASAAPSRETTLEGRAILPFDPPGPSTCPPPSAEFPRQPLGGYSALLEGPGRGSGRDRDDDDGEQGGRGRDDDERSSRGGRGGSETFYAMPDNGYGSKANSCQFVLRTDIVRVTYERARSGPQDGRVEVLDSIRLRDPDRKVPFPIVSEGTRERLLTGSDFDPESMRIDRRGDFWFGDEFGPFLLHTDSTGKVLEAPIEKPGVRAPENQYPGPPPNLRSSSGFEGMAISPSRRFLYPSLERALNEEPDKTRHPIYQFDLKRGRYTSRQWIYRADPPVPPEQEHVIGDLTALDEHRLLVIERDFLQGPAARFEKVFLVDLRRTAPDGTLLKREVVDLLNIRDPALISLPGRPGDFGLGDPFKFPYITTESVLPVGGRRLAIVNDNNFGSVGGRHPTLPDYTDFIEIEVPALRGEAGRDGERQDDD